MKTVIWEDGFGVEHTTEILEITNVESRDLILTRHPISQKFVLVEVADEAADYFYGQPVEG